jgi:hypothetical protein
LCFGATGSYIRLNSALYNDVDVIEAMGDTVRHEMGHIFDLTHTGTGDSFGTGGERASLVTCLGNSFDTSRVLGQDDGAAIQYHVGSQSTPPVTANIGFEEDATTPRYWGKTGGSWSIVSSGGAYEGGNYLTWLPSNPAGDYLYQTTNLTREPSAGDEAIDVKLLARSVSQASGTVQMYIYQRSVTYAAEPDCDQWPTETDQNDRVWVTAYALVVGSADQWTPTTSWSAEDSPDVAVSLDFTTCNPRCVHAWDVRVRIYSTVNIGGDYLAVDFDNMRMRGGL